MTDNEKLLIQRWIVEYVDESVVPVDEGNGDGLIYNLVRLLWTGTLGADCYTYEPEQDVVIERLKALYSSVKA